MSKYIELAKKLHALAKKGVGGEAKNAQMMLDRLLKKHNITLVEIEEDALITRRFVYKDEFHKQFIMQVAASIAGKNLDFYAYMQNGRRVKNAVGISLNNSDFIELDVKLNFYWKLWQEESDIFYDAFVQKQRLYTKRSEDDESIEQDKELTLEEKQKIYKMSMMMNGIERKSPNKQLNA